MVGSSSNIGMYLTESVCNVLRDARDGTYGVFVLCQQYIRLSQTSGNNEQHSQLAIPFTVRLIFNVQVDVTLLAGLDLACNLEVKVS
jgi:hypothetical protein